MTITDWIQANSVWIAFGIIALVLVYYIVEAIENFKKRTATFVLLVGLLLIIYLAFNIRNIEPADQVQIILLLALLTVTGIYANANVVMAEEMRKQRYASLKPIIIIQVNHSQVQFQVRPQNIGPGAALNPTCFLSHDRFNFQTKRRIRNLASNGDKVEAAPLPLEQGFEPEKWIEVTINCDYEDIYGHRFRSSVVHPGQEDERLEITDLKGDS